MGAGTSFVGRHDEHARVVALLRTNRFVTLTGSGGIGKTRLAAEIASGLRGAYPGGAFIATLASATADDDLSVVVARQFGHDSLDGFMLGNTGVPALVIIDNCEHVASAARDLIEALLLESELTVLATSRVSMGVAAEQVFPLMPLQVPSADDLSAPAFQLFLDRADGAGATWPRSPENLEAVAAIVRRLDGVPLAIELAAARSRALAPGELVLLLARQLDVLDGVATARPGRHRSIRGAIHSSYEPLDRSVQKLFRQMGVLADAADLDLVHAVAGDGPDALATFDLLTELVDHSLVQAQHDEQGRTTYRMLEPIRAFAREQLDVVGEEAGAIERYIAGVVTFADEVVLMAMTTFSAEVIDRIADRYSHLVTALELSFTHDSDPGRAYRLILPFYAPTRAPRQEVSNLGRRIREKWPSTPAPFLAEAYAVMAHTAMWAGDSEAGDLANTVIKMNGDNALADTISYRVLAFSAARGGDRGAGIGHVEAAMDAATALGGSFQRELQMTWASLVDDPAQRAEAITTLEVTSAEAAEHGETVTLVWATVASGHHHLLDKNFDAARRAADRATVLAARTGAPWAGCAADRLMATVLTMSYDWTGAFGYWGSAFERVVAIGDIEGVTLTLRSAAAAAEYARETELAEKLWELVPPRRGVSALPPLFAVQMDDLRVRLGDPLPMSLGESVRSARQIFGAATTSREKPPHTSGDAPSTIRFGLYELDSARRELRCEGEPVHVEPQVFDVLVALALNPGRLVTKEQLLDEVWGDRFVSASALTTRIKSARAATGDDGVAQIVIRTIHGKGFMFVAELR